MSRRTFRGGVHPLRGLAEGKDLTQDKPVRTMPPPGTLIIPMARGAGTPAEPLVKKGDTVFVGQKIGEAQGHISTPVHASVSGRVTAVERRPHPGGSKVLAAVIENDGQDTPDPLLTPHPDWRSLDRDALLSLIREAGVVGMGGAAFPTHVKLSPPEGVVVDTLIINGVECEPYLTADHRLMLESPDDVVEGIDLIRAVLPSIKDVYIGIELNKRDAISLLHKKTAQMAGVSVVPLPVKYPQGAERQLIYAVTQRTVPLGKLPMHVGVVVMNVGTVATAVRAVRTGMPVIERIVTVTGDAVKEPANLLVRVGTPIADCIAFCGGTVGPVSKIVVGGPMMGLAQPDDRAPVIAGSSGILVLSEKAAEIPEPGACIRCGRCIQACPLNLMPVYLARAADAGDFDEAQRLHAMDCVECGSCSFICPSHRYLMQSIRLAKNQIRRKSKK